MKRTDNLTGSPATFVALNTILKRAREHFRFVEGLYRTLADDVLDARRKEQLLALADGHAKLGATVETTRRECQDSDRYFQVLPQSPARSIEPVQFDADQAELILSQAHQKDEDWVIALRAMASQTPEGSRIGELLHALTTKLVETQRRTSLRQLGSLDI